MVKINKTAKGNLGIFFPDEVVKELGLTEKDEVEVEVVHGDVAVLYPKGKTSRKKGTKKSKTKKGGKVIQKLKSIPFSQRTKERVEKDLSKKQLNKLKNLEQQGAINFYKKGKYEDKGVYSISQEYFGQQASEGKSSGIKEEIAEKGYVKISNKKKIGQAIRSLKPEVKNGKIITVKDFKKNLYAVKNELVEDLGSKIIAQIENGNNELEEIQKNVDEDPGLCKAITEILRESGDLIEKREHEYELA